MGWSSADDRVAVRLVGGLAETAGVPVVPRESAQRLRRASPSERAPLSLARPLPPAGDVAVGTKRGRRSIE